VLLDWSAHPVDLGVSGDGGVVDVDHDDLIVLVGGVLTHPVGVQDPQALESSANSFLSNGLKVSLRLLLLDSTRSLGLTIGTSLGNRTLAATTPHGDAVDDESLLGLVSQPASFVWPGWARGTVDLGQLAILPAPDPEQISHDIALFLPVQLGYVLVGTHPDLPTSENANIYLNLGAIEQAV